VYAVDKPETLARVQSYWLPEIRRVRASEVRPHGERLLAAETLGD
jgi:hypothetical protein